MKKKKKVIAKGLDEVFDAEIVEEETTDMVPESIDGDDSVLVCDDNEIGELVPSKKLEDSDYIRQELKGMVDKAKDALETALSSQEEEANTWTTNSVATLVATVNNTLNGLLALNKVEEEIQIKKGKKSDPNHPTVAANVIIATTDDLIEKITQKMLGVNSEEKEG